MVQLDLAPFCTDEWGTKVAYVSQFLASAEEEYEVDLAHVSRMEPMFYCIPEYLRKPLHISLGYLGTKVCYV